MEKTNYMESLWSCALSSQIPTVQVATPDPSPVTRPLTPTADTCGVPGASLGFTASTNQPTTSHRTAGPSKRDSEAVGSPIVSLNQPSQRRKRLL